MDPTPSQPLDIRDYVRPILAHKFLILALVVVVTGLTYYHYNKQPRVYSTATDIYVQSLSPAEQAANAAPNYGLSDRTLGNEARLARTLPVAERTAKILNYRGNPMDLLAPISVSPSSGADFLTISVTTGNAVLTARLANAFAQAYVDVRASTSKAQLQQRLSAARLQYQQMTSVERNTQLGNQAIQNVRLLESALTLSTSDAHQVEPAGVPGAPLSPNPRKNAIFAFVLSLFAGILGAYGLNRIDQRIRKTSSVEPLYHAPLLVNVPRTRQVAPTEGGNIKPADGLVEVFRTLRATLDFTAPGDHRALLVTSAVPREGKSMVVRNLALAYRELGRRVAVVEADLRRPSLAGLMGVAKGPGLGDVIANEIPLADALQNVDVEVKGLDALRRATTNGTGPHTGSLCVLVAGGPVANPATLLATRRARVVIDELRRDFDIVLIDSPPLLPVGDALQLIQMVDGVVLVARVGATTDDNATQLIELVNRVPEARILGVVANDVAPAAMTYGAGSYEYGPA